MLCLRNFSVTYTVYSTYLRSYRQHCFFEYGLIQRISFIMFYRLIISFSMCSCIWLFCTKFPSWMWNKLYIIYNLRNRQYFHILTVVSMQKQLGNLDWSVCFKRIKDYPELNGTHENGWVQLLVLHRTTPGVILYWRCARTGWDHWETFLELYCGISLITWLRQSRDGNSSCLARSQRWLCYRAF